MKKTLLALALVTALSFGASAQCTPDTTHFTATKHVYPDTLPCVQFGQSFSGVVSLVVPDSIDGHDFYSAIPSGTSVYLDSIQITSISGYPAGITSTSVPALGTSWLKPGQFACAHFTGTTTAANGQYDLTITGNGCGHVTFPVIGYADSCITNVSFSRVYPYHLTVCGSTVGITEVINGVSLNVFPNPNQGSFNVSISTDDRITGDISVMDALGRTVHTEALDVTGTKQIALDLGNVSAGVYVLLVNTANGKAVKQFTVK
ncbi:MAG: T9SS type A sorting domain-containing protein [Bacteroidetes bacterium]|nr:T9SS type A sorting domain-containing protein [Bacteroidota bacterium]